MHAGCYERIDAHRAKRRRVHLSSYPSKTERVGFVPQLPYESRNRTTRIFDSSALKCRPEAQGSGPKMARVQRVSLLREMPHRATSISGLRPSLRIATLQVS